MKLADTSWLVALLQAADCHHSRAVTLCDRIQVDGTGPILVTEAVVFETLQVLESRYGVSPANGAEAIGSLCGSEDFAIDPVALDALKIVAARPVLGFVDGLLIACARRDRAPVLTFDRALERALVSGSSAP
ncbi:MAG: type II toxin-antitoxin system VapC family toxin [Actinobacteria bacterium]|nr:MAG: type II toxin-antitoxin system VapC family toxin [Actinomycetota bacterium]